MVKPYIPNDKWSRRAADEGFRARSVYKLQELDERFGLLRTGMKVLDIGAAPGSWLQYASKRIGSDGLALGLDLKEIAHINGNVKTRVCDITDEKAVEAALASVGWTQADIVLSDIMPNTTGIKDVDQWRSVELSREVLKVARRFLRPGGTLVMKVFRGKSFDEFTADVKRDYPAIKVVTVDASRDRSREVYVLGFGVRR
jgi:23S rRNA (uridine2552-2'-O)-methyltransferase